MIYQEMYINNGKMDFRNITLEHWIDNMNWKLHGWIHFVINRKGKAAFYDLYGHEIIKQIHNSVEP